ncbi:hypothetical protein, partial [Klebsiella aerogenes]|uniref:hypothetical protein n=1 Tax=Klebsiella aerogenes TaxID=548 RepID=UPI003877B48D
DEMSSIALAMGSGHVIDFDQCIADSMEQELEERFGFQIQSHLLEFYGLCADCQERTKPPLE